jgi:hypothetical protein
MKYKASYYRDDIARNKDFSGVFVKNNEKRSSETKNVSKSYKYEYDFETTCLWKKLVESNTAGVLMQ